MATLSKSTCYDNIDAEEAIKLWEMSGGFTRDGRGYTYADDTSADLLAGYDVTLNRTKFKALVGKAQSIMFWHYGYDIKCSREVQVNIGNQTFCVDVKCDENLHKPQA
jgi:hypothetical protein